MSKRAEAAEPMDDHQDENEDEADVDPDADPSADPLEPPEPDPAEPNPAMESIEEILAKKEEGGDDVASLLDLGREERLEPLAVKVVPKQETEFVCKRCFLVKHLSQRKDKKRQLCRDCA